jgi:hypothetical protein
VLDVDEDRKHPLKRFRPVASGEVPVPAAVIYSVLLVAAGLALCFYVNVGVGAAGLAYLALQAVYTPFLKHMAILDVMSISAGFVIRALAGVAAVNSPISPWLIVCTGLLTLFLGFSKRRHELATLGDGAVGHRKNLRDYSVPLLGRDDEHHDLGDHHRLHALHLHRLRAAGRDLHDGEHPVRGLRGLPLHAPRPPRRRRQPRHPGPRRQAPPDLPISLARRRRRTIYFL